MILVSAVPTLRLHIHFRGMRLPHHSIPLSSPLPKYVSFTWADTNRIQAKLIKD